MSDIAIRVEHLRKAYRIGQEEQRHETLLGAMASVIRAPLRNFRKLRKLTTFKELGSPNNPQQAIKNEPSDIFWALKDVSFEVKHGEVLGIIGRNGAGKSTLLKILSRITEPTSGRAMIYGRVGSLLEVGTGFHPDLTGRENVYLNGTILGMRKIEVDKKFDEILAFSEVEKFIETPVKRYSSGMRVRLAFAVAAHLDPEILIVDEVLAVGDLNFQRKCLGKMGEVAQQGRTVLFVSHNMAAVIELCQRGLVLDHGMVCFEGTASQSVNRYVQNSQSSEVAAPMNGATCFQDLRVNQSMSPRLIPSEPMVISATLRGGMEGNPWIYLILEDASGAALVHDRRPLSEITGMKQLRNCQVEVALPPLFISPGLYSIYFKAISATVGSNSRVVSMKLPIEVRGESSSLGKSLLSPSVRWQVKE